jgi:alpha-L-rhamnosidase
VSYSNITPYGNAGITWKREKGKYIMDITVPVGSEATVYVPVDEMKKVTESGQAIDQIKEVQVASQESEQLVLEVGSGEYHFEF